MEPRTRWSEVSGGPGAATAYQQRFDDLAAQGMDIHGEAAFVASLLSPPVRVLDAGCGTGRVATQLTALGYHCVGVDADAAMIEVAEQRDPATTWVRQDLSRLQLRSQAFELAVLAGNVIPLLAPGTLLAVVQRLAAHLQPGGLLVAGFGLDCGPPPPGLSGDPAGGLRPGLRRRRPDPRAAARDLGPRGRGGRTPATRSRSTGSAAEGRLPPAPAQSPTRSVGPGSAQSSERPSSHALSSASHFSVRSRAVCSALAASSWRVVRAHQVVTTGSCCRRSRPDRC